MQYLTRNQLLLCIAPIVALVVCLAIYFNQSQTLPYRSPSTPYITNSVVLRDWMPQSVYTTMMSYLGNYLATNNITDNSMSVRGRPSVNLDGQIVFTLLINSQSHTVAVRTFDYGSGSLGTSITIDGQQQDYQVPATNNGTTFNNMDSLTNSGVTALQATELQQALQKFAPSASSVTVDPNSIVQPNTDPNNPSLTRPYTFSVSVDSKTYTARLDCIGLSQVQLFLFSAGTSKQVFDSGILGQS